MPSPIRFISKTFDTLTLNELYGLMALRQKVFIVEQNCPYLDADDKDQDAIHLMGQDENSNIVGYTRLLPKGISYDDYCSIGRVATHPDYRNQQLGKKIMQASIKHCQSNFGSACAIKISAQAHLEKFYSQFGFVTTGNYYLEDGIPHVSMILDH